MSIYTIILCSVIFAGICSMVYAFITAKPYDYSDSENKEFKYSYEEEFPSTEDLKLVNIISAVEEEQN